jgi:hypothetical protein
MPASILPSPFHKILVVGPLYSNIEKLSVLTDMMPEYDWIIFNGGLCYPSGDLSQVRDRIARMNKLVEETGKVIYVTGRSDYILYSNLEEKDKDIAQWIRTRCNILIADFPGRTVLVMDGGLPRGIKGRAALQDNLEISFVSGIDGKPWHEWYDGRLGYIISNNPMTSKFPQYYNCSMQLGHSSSLYAQEVGELGLQRTILL